MHLYGFLLEKGSVMQIMISYVAWKNGISLLLKDEKNKDFNNYLAEACHYLIFNSNGFGDHKDDIIESRINATKDINYFPSVNFMLMCSVKFNIYVTTMFTTPNFQLVFSYVVVLFSLNVFNLYRLFLGIIFIVKIFSVSLHSIKFIGNILRFHT